MPLPPALSKVQHRQDWLLKENENISFKRPIMTLPARKKVKAGRRQPYVMCYPLTLNMEAFMTTTSSLYHNQGIKSFNHVATEYRGGTNYTRIERKEHSLRLPRGQYPTCP